jgi:hypothetical protein
MTEERKPEWKHEVSLLLIELSGMPEHFDMVLPKTLRMVLT